MNTKIICVVGPTAVGKTSLGVKLAQKYNGEIISGDSIQIYKELDIGSAKVTEEEKQGIKHYLIDELELTEAYNVNDFQTKCRKLIKEISENNKLPIIVGGTGLYIKAAVYDYYFPVYENNDTNEEKYQQFTNEELKKQLEEADPGTAENIHVNNRKRLIRALQLIETGNKRSEILKEQVHELIDDVLMIGLTMDRERLYSRIEQRVDIMIDNGLFEEIDNLYKKYPKLFEYRGIQGIGYKEWEDYYNQTKKKDEVIEQIKIHSRQFARRQYTWFNNQMNVTWFDIESENYEESIYRSVENFLG